MEYVIGILLLAVVVYFLTNKDSEVEAAIKVPKVVKPTVSTTKGILIDSDMALNGQQSDKNDQQALLFTLPFLNQFKFEGFVSTGAYTSSVPVDGVAAFNEVINNYYAQMYSYNQLASKGYPSPESLTSQAYYGARGSDETYRGFNDGAQKIIDAAHRYSPENRLDIVIWGTITTVAQAIHRDPTIKPKIRLFPVLSWNRDQDQESYDYLVNFHNDGTLELLGDEAAHSGIRNKNSDYESNGRLATTEELHRWRDEVLYSVPFFEAGWKNYAQYASGDKEIYRISAGDFPTVLAALYPAFYNGNYTKRVGVNFWMDDNVSYFSQRRDLIYTLIENGLMDFGLSPDVRWF